MQYKCDQCDKYFKTHQKVKRHIKRVHDKEIKTDIQAQDKQITADKPQKLEIQKIEIKEDKPRLMGQQQYHCVACGNPVSKSMNVCPVCGVGLSWESLAL